jgi:CheY-like chemotaxis protein
MSRWNATVHAPAQQRRALILVVEDDVTMRDLMKASLECEGFEVVAAANGLEGLREYEQHQHQVDVVVTDLEMPSMNGQDMLRQIFKITPSMKVLIASGCSDEFPARCRLTKPYTARELAAAVHQLL